jgi:tRNA A-37 threonylcarbamoyl transferase component Bud32
VRAAWRAALFGGAMSGAAEFDPQRWVSVLEASEVKRSARRKTFRVERLGRRWYVKEFRPSGWTRWFTSCPAEREAKAAEELERAGVATAPVVAWGRDPSGRSWLVTTSPATARTVESWLGPRRGGALGRLPRVARGRARRALLRQLVRFVAASLEAGLRHADVHLGNILATPVAASEELATEAEAWQLAWLDLDGATPGGAASQRERREPWIRLAASALWVVRRGDLHRALDELTAGTASAEERAAWRRELLQYMRTVAARRDRRCLRANRSFRQAVVGAWRVIATSDLAAPVRELAARFAGEPSETAILKRGRTNVVWRSETPGDERPVVVKESRSRRAGRAWVARFWPSKLERAWRIGHALVARGLPTPRPRAWLRSADGGAERLVVDELPGASTLHGWIDATRDPSRRRRMAWRLGALAGRLHAWHFTHRDLKAGNILVSGGRPWLVDLDGTALGASPTFRRRTRDLARLESSLRLHPSLSRTERLRGLRAYLRAAEMPEAEWRSWWAAIAAEADAGDRRRAARGRPAG